MANMALPATKNLQVADSIDPSSVRIPLSPAAPEKVGLAYLLILLTKRKASLVIAILVLALGLNSTVPPAWAAESGSRTEYVGGTLPSIPHNSGGAIRATDGEFFQFRTNSGTFKLGYQKINLIEYGQKVDRRYVLAIVISPPFLLTKSRKHYATLGYADEAGRQQAAVFRVGKGDIRSLLAGLEARTGLKFPYQDDEARKAGKG
jgi:hypothetical protein